MKKKHPQCQNTSVLPLPDLSEIPPFEIVPEMEETEGWQALMGSSHRSWQLVYDLTAAGKRDQLYQDLWEGRYEAFIEELKSNTAFRRMIMQALTDEPLSSEEEQEQRKQKKFHLKDYERKRKNPEWKAASVKAGRLLKAYQSHPCTDRSMALQQTISTFLFEDSPRMAPERKLKALKLFLHRLLKKEPHLGPIATEFLPRILKVWQPSLEG